MPQRVAAVSSASTTQSVEVNLVIAGAGDLAIVGKERPVAQLRRTEDDTGVRPERFDLHLGKDLDLAGLPRPVFALDQRHYEHIAEVDAASSLEVRVAETVDDVVAIVIAGAVLPLIPVTLDVPVDIRRPASIGTELDQAERYHSAREHVSAPARADEGISAMNKIGKRPVCTGFERPSQRGSTRSRAAGLEKKTTRP